MKRRFLTFLVGAVVAMGMTAPAASAGQCPDPDNPCDIQPIDVWGDICARVPKLPKCWQ